MNKINIVMAASLATVISGTVLGLTSTAAAPAAAADHSVHVICPSHVIVPATSITEYPGLVHGDRNFGGHGPSVTVSAKLSKVNGLRDALYVTVRMRAEETRADWTTAGGETQRRIYRAPVGCDIDMTSLRYGTFDSNGYLNRVSNDSAHTLAAGDAWSFVSGYRVWDDHPGVDVGTFTRAVVSTKPLWVGFN